MPKYDYTIVGAGLFGCTFAREMADLGFKSQIFDKRPHIGGNVYTENMEGIDVHMYGPHIFHTNSKQVWRFVNRFAEFNNFSYRCKVNYQNKIYSFPINLMTIHQLWPDVISPSDVKEAISRNKEIFGWKDVESPANLEEWAINQIGPTLYHYFIKGYTKKQWGRDPKELPSSIIKRLPIRLTYDDRYFKNCDFEGIPVGGYTRLIERMVEGVSIHVNLGVGYSPSEYHPDHGTIVWTGPIDAYYDYCFGRLEYRSLKFKHEICDRDFQGNAVVNYTEAEVPFTRILEHKHFALDDDLNTKSVITREYPQAKGEPFYPIRDEANLATLQRYKELEPPFRTIFGGRLGTYQYYDMDQVIAQARATAEREVLARATRQD